MTQASAPSLANERLVRNDSGLLSELVDDELVGMSIEAGTCYGFNGVATRVWELLAEPRSIDELSATLVDEYDVEAETCRRDLVALIDTLREQGLVTSAAG